MGQGHKPDVARVDAAEQAMRDQEVLRANRELSAYFKGRRTEREARAALKIIKAFVRDRERLDPRSRPVLPGADPAKTPKKVTNRDAATDSDDRHRRTPPSKPLGRLSKSAAVLIEREVDSQSAQSLESDEPTT